MPPRRQRNHIDEAAGKPLALRAADRDAELAAARAEYEERPKDEAARSRYELARRSHAAGMSVAEGLARSRRIIELVGELAIPARAVEQFARETGLELVTAYAWYAAALKDSRAEVEVMRAWSILRMQRLAAEASAAGDYRSAVAAVSAAAKLGGVRDEMTLTCRRGADEEVPAEVLAIANDPAALAEFLRSGRLPSREEAFAQIEAGATDAATP